ncbi:MAG: hypothetical protein AAF311_00070 [Pseudomonadota bacterium]
MTIATKPEKNSDEMEAEFKKMRDEANEAELTSSPALNDDAETRSDGAGDQSLPEGNRFD